MSRNRPVVGVSSCLLGHKIRYDGNDKLDTIIKTVICTQFHCIPLCPEYAIGLGVPRVPVQLIQAGDSIRVLSMENQSVDNTILLQRYADFICDALPQISGYVFKARSPSCGLVDTPVFDLNGRQIGIGQGAYAHRITSRYKSLPVIDEINLRDTAKQADFIQRVKSNSP